MSEAMDFFRLAQTKGRLKLEILGIKGRGPSAYSQAKAWYGLRGSRKVVLAQLATMVEDAIEKKQGE